MRYELLRRWHKDYFRRLHRPDLHEPLVWSSNRFNNSNRPSALALLGSS
jgi:hypothetical protein